MIKTVNKTHNIKMMLLKIIIKNKWKVWWIKINFIILDRTQVLVI